jgi:hypothetical protein
LPSRRYRGRNSLAGTVTHVNARLNTVEKRAVPKRIKEGGIGGDLLADSSVTTNQLASGAVLSENLAEGSVSTSKIADGSVTTAKLAADALSGVVIPENSIDTPQLVDFAVETAKIANAAVTNIKLGSDIEATKIASGQFSTDRIPGLDASKIVSSTFNVDRIPLLPASKINTSAPFSTALIPNLSASIITTGAFDDGRIPNLDAGKITSGVFDQARISLPSNPSFTSITVGSLSFSSNGSQLEGPGFRATGNINIVGDLFVAMGEAAATPVHVDGNNKFTKGTSSKRYKEQLEILENPEYDVLSMPIYKFKYLSDVRDNGENAYSHTGYISEELDELGMSNFVIYQTLEDGSKIPDGVHFNSIFASLHLVVKSQASKIDELTSKISSLESRITALESS